MKNHIALAIALALGSTFAIAGDKHKSDSTSAPATEKSATQDQAQPKSGVAMKEGAAGAAGPEATTGASGAASGDAAGASATTNASGEVKAGDADKEDKAKK
ncbi:MAG: hypothetical protein M3Q32_05395 [Pseudomonadota bacterium]|nr:hypothetical protein [Burkholderiales bacterium]MDQ3195803.1 hypothetical protein [Pseudomonadota bacterium]